MIRILAEEHSRKTAEVTLELLLRERNRLKAENITLREQLARSLGADVVLRLKALAEEGRQAGTVTEKNLTFLQVAAVAAGNR